jgi:hypothetical protein
VETNIMRKTAYLFAIAGLTLTSQAWAGPQCTTEPKTKWQDAKAFEAELAKTYSIKKFKTTSGNCYEIYGRDQQGKKVEIYFNPVDGKIVKQERE